MLNCILDYLLCEWIKKSLENDSYKTHTLQYEWWVNWKFNIIEAYAIFFNIMHLISTCRIERSSSSFFPFKDESFALVSPKIGFSTFERKWRNRKIMNHFSWLALFLFRTKCWHDNRRYWSSQCGKYKSKFYKGQRRI